MRLNPAVERQNSPYRQPPFDRSAATASIFSVSLPIGFRKPSVCPLIPCHHFISACRSLRDLPINGDEISQHLKGLGLIIAYGRQGRDLFTAQRRSCKKRQSIRIEGIPRGVTVGSQTNQTEPSKDGQMM